MIARHVAAANQSSQNLQVLRLSKLYHVATYAEEGLEPLLRELASVVRVGLRLVDAGNGLVLADAAHVGGPEAGTALRRHRLRGAHEVGLVVTEFVDEHLDAFLLVHLMKMLEVATDRVLNDADRHAEVGDRLMHAMLSGSMPRDAVRRMHPHLATDGYQLAALDLRRTSEIARLVALRRAPVIVGAGRTRGLALVPETAVQELRAVRDLSDVPMGVSSTFYEAGDARAAAVEAARVLEAAQGSKVAWSEFEGSTLAVLARSIREARDIVTGVLGPLATEAPRMTSLRETLFAYLRHDRSWNACALELAIHRQSLAHRLRRIQEETGLDLARTADVSAAWIAMQAWEALASHPTPTPGPGPAVIA